MNVYTVYSEWSICLCLRCQDHVMGCHVDPSARELRNKAELRPCSGPEFIFFTVIVVLVPNSHSHRRERDGEGLSRARNRNLAGLILEPVSRGMSLPIHGNSRNVRFGTEGQPAGREITKR